MLMRSVQVAEVMLNECFHDSAEVMGGRLLPEEQARVAPVPPAAVLLARYQDKKYEKSRDTFYL